MKKNSLSVDILSGNLFKGILIYALPLILSGLLQILYNSADLIAVGRFSGKTALAAVGATTSLIHLVVNVFVNFSIGASVAVATDIGAGKLNKVKNSVHSAYFFAIVSGIFVMILGFFSATPLLRLIKTPDDVISLSSLYMKIYFLGAPATLVYNFGNAVLNANGETKKPLYYLTFSGLVNVILNLILVIFFNMSVDGVAIATVVSQYISAFLVTRNLVRRDDCIKLSIKEIGFYKEELIRIIKIGFPAGLQGAAFSLSNALIQSSINIFGADVLAGNTAAQNVESFVYTAMNGFTRAALTFAAQNFGAKNYKRVKKTFVHSLILIILFSGAFALVILGFPKQILGLYVKDRIAISHGTTRLWYIVLPYFLCGIMELAANIIRAVGYSFLPAVSTVVGVCGIRILWIFTVFVVYKTPESVYIAYTLSWLVTFLFHLICMKVIFKKQQI